MKNVPSSLLALINVLRTDQFSFTNEYDRELALEAVLEGFVMLLNDINKIATYVTLVAERDAALTELAVLHAKLNEIEEK